MISIKKQFSVNRGASQSKFLLSVVLLPVFAAAVASGATITWTNLYPDSSYSGAYGVNATNEVGFYAFWIGSSEPVTRPALWSGSRASMIDLFGLWVGGTASGSDYGKAYAISGNKFVGSFWHQGYVEGQGIMGWWSDGSPSTLLFNSGILRGMTETQQVGTKDYSAFLWTGDPNTGVNLHPAGAAYSAAYAIAGSRQGGSSTFNENGTLREHAGWWSGTANSFVDLHVSGAPSSRVEAVSTTQQGGWFWHNAYGHRAYLWSGTAASGVDMNPMGAFSSQIHGMCETRQVGQASYRDESLGTYVSHAVIWAGTQSSAIDLHSVLDTNVFKSSVAYGVWSDGRVTRIVGAASSNGRSEFYNSPMTAILWTIREPLPPIQVTHQDTLHGSTAMTLSWTNSGRSCALQGSASPVGGWAPVSGAWATNNNTISITVSNMASAQFYRLVEN